MPARSALDDSFPYILGLKDRRVYFKKLGICVKFAYSLVKLRIF